VNKIETNLCRNQTKYLPSEQNRNKFYVEIKQNTFLVNKTEGQ